MRVAVDQDISPADRLVAGLPDEWDLSVGLPGSAEPLIEALDGVDVVCVTSRIPVNREVIEATDLAVVAKLGTGIDNVDLAAAEAAGIPVTYTPGHNALSVAEHTLCLLLATARRLTEGRTLLEAGKWRDEITLGTRLSGKTVGIVGFGNVGKRFGELLAGFNVDVLIADPYVPTIDAEYVGGEMVDLDDLLARSEAVVVTAELTEETRGLLDAGAFDRMRDAAILVNTARGPIVDEAALLDALENGAIAGAGLDVFETEPPGADSPLLEHESVVASPHVAAMTHESRADTIDQLVENVRAIVDGEPIQERYLATPD